MLKEIAIRKGWTEFFVKFIIVEKQEVNFVDK